MNEKEKKEEQSSNSWIPSIFRKNKDGNIEIVSDINNLSRTKYPKLYKIIAAVFKKMLPSFEWISGYDFDKENINEYKVIVKMMNYELYHMDEYYKSIRHREGDKKENIIAVGIYYYYKSDDITNDIFTIDHDFKTGEYEKERIEQSIVINRDNFVVFNNRWGFQHHLSQLYAEKRLPRTSMIAPLPGSSVVPLSSPQIVFKRKILAFFLVDPKAKSYKTSMNVIVNIEDKLKFIVTSWWRDCFMKKTLSIDIINLISIFSHQDKSINKLNRNVNKLIDFLQDAENEYANRPRPRKKN